MKMSWMFLALACSLLLNLAHAAEDYELKDETRAVRAVITKDVVENILASGHYETEELSDAEARERAKESGITLPTVESAENYGRPWFIVKASIGLPNLIAGAVEVFVHRNWTIELGAGAGLLPTVFEGSVRWRPDATCWGCDGKNMFSIGFGLDPGVYFNGEGAPKGTVGLMLTGTVDAMYIHRFARHFGLMVGSRLGVGAVTEIGPATNSGKVEPTFKINLLQVGFAF